jgi:hypothetical protein
MGPKQRVEDFFPCFSTPPPAEDEEQVQQQVVLILEHDAAMRCVNGSALWLAGVARQQVGAFTKRGGKRHCAGPFEGESESKERMLTTRSPRTSEMETERTLGSGSQGACV